MFLPTHACLAMSFSNARRRTWSPAEHRSFWIGAILPDLPAVVPGCWEMAKYCRWVVLGSDEVEPIRNVIWTNTGYYRHCIFAREVLHNVWFWALILLVAALLMRRADHASRIRPIIGKIIRPLAWGAIFFHIGMDWPTHLLPVHNYLWPLTAHPLIGFVSHANPALTIFEVVFCTLWWGAKLMPSREQPHLPPSPAFRAESTEP